AYQTREGRKFYLVDPLKKAKAPLFDHAKIAATLTSITREPYDAQHLPFAAVKFVKKDAAFQFDVQVPRDADVVKPKRPTTTSSSDAQVGSKQDGQHPDRRDLRDTGAPGARWRVNRAAVNDAQRRRAAKAARRASQPPKNPH